MPQVELRPDSQKSLRSAFRQQELIAWQPILTAGTVLPGFFIIALACIPIGIGLLLSSNEVKEVIVDYTGADCKKWDSASGELCKDVIIKDPKTECSCLVPFNLTEDFKPDVFIYYGLTNFYQNHRRYMKSRNDKQYYGTLKEVGSCEPFAKVINKDGQEKTVVPCGAVANSLFTDKLTILRKSPSCPTINKDSPDCQVPVLSRGIAWKTDKEARFKNPEKWEEFSDSKYIKPKNWEKPIQDTFSEEGNRGFENEDFIVWMRTAAFPTFRKLYRKVDHSKEGYKNGLQKGEYVLFVNYKYEVASFRGTKRLIISNTSWLGGKNNFLGIVYVIIGGLCLLFSIVLTIIHKKYGKSRVEILNITPRTAY